MANHLTDINKTYLLLRPYLTDSSKHRWLSLPTKTGILMQKVFLFFMIIPTLLS